MNVYIKWFIVVSLNAVLPFTLGYQQGNFIHLAGMICGTLTWFIIYASLDIFLERTGHQHISRRLFLSAVLRIPLQFVLRLDMLAGLLAMATVEQLALDKISSSSFASSYMTTVFTGLYLSVICAAIYLFIWVISAVIKLHDKNK